VSSATTQKILVTGSAGRIGQASVQALAARGYFVRGFDRASSRGVSEEIVGDVADFESVKKATAGMDAVIHLAAIPDDDDFMTKLLPNNIVAVHHIFEAAKASGVKRMILASSGQVNWHQQFTGPFPIKTTDPLQPRHWYAAAKIFAEAAGMIFASAHGMDVVAMRLGACPRDRALIEFIGGTEHGRDVYLSPGDVGRFMVKAVEAPGGFGFQIVNVFSKPFTRHIFDPEPARRLFGYEPQDRWPEGIPPEIIGDKPIPGAS
jgi:uronate dehydrogenase